MKRIFIHLFHQISASDYYRKLLPYRHCRTDLEKEGILLEIAHDIDPQKHYDAIFCSRIIEPYIISHLLARVVRHESRIFWDLDDNYWCVPDYNGNKLGIVQLDCLWGALGICNEVTVSTQHLASYIQAGPAPNRNPWVLPNLIDIDDWKQPVKTHKRRNPEDILICWAGTNTHDQDLMDILPILKEVCQGQVKLLIFGDVPFEMGLEMGSRIIQQEWVPLNEYPHTLKSWKPNIGICPLLHHEFNSSKSAIKYFEMAMAGAVVIGSGVGQYRQMNEMLLVLDKDRLQALVEELPSSTCETVRHRQRQEVCEKHSWQSQKEIWMEGFRTMLR